MDINLKKMSKKALSKKVKYLAILVLYINVIVCGFAGKIMNYDPTKTRILQTSCITFIILVTIFVFSRYKVEINQKKITAIVIFSIIGILFFFIRKYIIN
jgi:hypothetical protein